MWTEQDPLAPAYTDEQRAEQRKRKRRMTLAGFATVGVLALGLALFTADMSEPPPVMEELEIEVNYIDEVPEEPPVEPPKEAPSEDESASVGPARDRVEEVEAPKVGEEERSATKEELSPGSPRGARPK